MATAEENYKRLSNELDKRLKADKRLAAIADKISKGKADFTDTEKYSHIVSQYMGEVISEYIGEITMPLGKEYVCMALLREHYDRINDVLGEVQASVDDKLGIHLNPIKAPFPTERVDKAAHSLEDPTVPKETIERRAKSVTENCAESMHDDYIKENAGWRSQAGLDCYLVRDAGGGCCSWCQALEGRYPYATAPDDVFRRHDNCHCSVTYECGKKRQDVWSKRTWEEPEDKLAARKELEEQSKSNITVLSKEQAEALNKQSQPVKFTQAEAKEREASILYKDSNVNNLLLEKQDESDKIKSEGLFCYGDYLRDVLGSAIENNPEETQRIINDIEQKGGKITFLPDSTKMVCNVEKGKPASIDVDANISLGGLKHEYRHFLDDIENGTPGLGFYLVDKDKFFEYEKRGYEEELKIARELNLKDVENKILGEIEKRRREIYGK